MDSSEVVKTPEKKMETEVQPSPKSSPTKKDIDVKTKAYNLYIQGKRHLLVQDISSAVNALQEACQLLAGEYGDLAVECADPYFNYGKALLDLARIENGVLGNALDGVPEEEEDLENSQVEDPEKLTEGQKEEVSDQVGEAIEENYKEIEKQRTSKEVKGTPERDSEKEKSKGEEKCDASDKEVNEDSAEGKISLGAEKETASNESEESQDEAKSSEDEKSADEQKEGEDDKSQDEEVADDNEAQMETDEPEEEGEKTEEEDEVSNLQLAWEMLELAKVIYQKQMAEKENTALKIAQVHLKLGEVSMENENYAQSIDDIKECIKIQTDELKPDDRCLAESYYQLGVAHSFSDDFDKGSECFGEAAKVIECRKANLIKIKEEKAGWTEEQKRKAAETCQDPLYSEQTEIEELEKLLPDIKEKITDMEEMKKDCKERMAKVKDAAFASLLGGSNGISNEASTSAVSNAFSASTNGGDSKPVSNISHLVRKKSVEKRKPEVELNGHDAKKAKLDPALVNGMGSITTKEVQKMDVTE